MIIPSKLSNKNKAKGITKGLPCSIHKYRRFTKKNKTFRTDLYFCADCGKSVEICKSFGVKTICWKCGSMFSMGINTPVFPKCEKCTNGSSENLVTTHDYHPPDLSFMEDTEPTKEELIENTLKELGLK